MDKLTVLETVGPSLTKTYRSDGTTDSYDDAASFHYKVVEVSDLQGLTRLLGKLHKNKKRCLIAGAPKGEGMESGNTDGSVARTNANFTDQPLHSFLIDIDGYRPGFADPVLDTENAVLDFFQDAKLGEAFNSCSFYWHLSSSAGMPGKEGILKCHVWLWSKTPYTCAQLTEWAKGIGPLVDRAVYRRVQIRYTADPVFEPGREDPVPVRCGFHQGLTDYVDLVIDDATLARAREQGAGEGGNDMPLKDPSEKEGLIGAFHKAFTAEDVLMRFLDEFEQVTERRYTWLNGGGTPEGVWVHDDGQHIGSSHNTWPIDGIANLWDVVRVFRFGDLDDEAPTEEDFDTLGDYQVGSRPSDLAMKAWAAELPELKDVVVSERTGELERLRQLIADAQDAYDMEHSAAAAIREAEVSDVERVILEQAFLARFKALGIPMTKPDVKRMLRARPARDASIPGWASEWVWVAEKDSFLNTITKQVVSERSFNALFDRNMAPFADANNAIPKASYMALVQWGVPVVARAIYWPGANVTFSIDGLECVNTYRDDLAAVMPDRYGKADLRAIEILEAHAAMLIPNDLERTYFLDYLAFCAKFPGRKIRWAPVLKGVEGDGKSAFLKLMGLVLGNSNVRVLANSTVESSDFTSWRAGQCFTGIEEVKLHGHNRYDVFNKLKEAISNDMIEIHPKGKDPYTVPNTTNYLLLTNFDDGIPVNDNDRRCMFLRSPFLTKEQLLECLRARGFESIEAYFKVVFDEAINAHAGALRRWLVERELSKDFNPNGRAPDTEARELIVDLSRREDEEAIDTVLGQEAFGIYPGRLIALKCLNDVLFNEYGIRLQTGRAKATLASRGYQMFSKGQVWWRGNNYRFYFMGDRPEHAAIEAERLEAGRQARELEDDFKD